jgi:hypothetical protein
MPQSRKAVSLSAERAARYLRDRDRPVGSRELAEAVLSMRIADDDRARRLLETAFQGDARLDFTERGWILRAEPEDGIVAAGDDRHADPAGQPDRVLILLRGRRIAARAPFQLDSVTAIRLREDTVVAACGGAPERAEMGDSLRQTFLEILQDAVPILHDPPGSVYALERWLDEPLVAPISLRRIGQVRLGLPSTHTLEDLAAKLRLGWRDTDDPLDLAETLESALKAITRPGEDLAALRAAACGGAPPIDWSRYEFGPSFLRSIPHVAGTYRFLDRQGELIYVGKSRNLHRRVGSYFAERGSRPARVQKLLDALRRIEIEPVGSDLEAVLREAAAIASEAPSANVQRRVHARTWHRDRLSSILILEPALPPLALRAYLIHEGRLLARVGIGPRGGGLRRIERILEDRFFSFVPGPTSVPGPELDVELIARWLGSHRDRVVAFDPTHLRSAGEVIGRLRLFLEQGGLFEPDGTPIRVR